MAGRGLSPTFLGDLRVGCLAPLLERVKLDDTLHLAIRNESINIYYRGGNLLRVSRNPDGADAASSYTAGFDSNYFTGSHPKVFSECPGRIGGKVDCTKWVDAFPLLKQEMDLWFALHPKREREYQQLVARANNRAHAATATDYFLIDIEYAEGEDRFDMIAALWESSGPVRKAAHARLAFIEMKYGDGALTGTAGIDKHIRGMNKFAAQPGLVDRVKAEALAMFEQQLDLKTIHAPKAISQFAAEEPEFILFLVDHDPDSSKLKKVLLDIATGIPKPVGYELKLCAATFMGQGLFKQNVYGLSEFLIRMRDQIHSTA
jgi:hypothetical protein